MHQALLLLKKKTPNQDKCSEEAGLTCVLGWGVGAGGRAQPEGPADPNLRGVHLPGRGPGAGGRREAHGGTWSCSASQVNGAPEPSAPSTFQSVTPAPACHPRLGPRCLRFSVANRMGEPQPRVTPGPLDGAARALLCRVPTLPGGGGWPGKRRDPGTSGHSRATGQGGRLSNRSPVRRGRGIRGACPSLPPRPPRKGANSMAKFRKIWVLSVSSLLQIS